MPLQLTVFYTYKPLIIPYQNLAIAISTSCTTIYLNSTIIEIKMRHFDIIIVGNGLASHSLLAALNQPSLNIAILDKNPITFYQSSGDSRPLSLTEGTLAALKKLGIHTSIMKNSTPIHQLHISEQGRFGNLQFHHNEFNLERLGAVIRYEQLQSALQIAAHKHHNITHITINDIKKIATDDLHTIISYKDNNKEYTLHTDLLIAADGMHSRCRTLLKLPTTSYNQNDHALIFQLDLQQPHNHTARQRFTKHGSLAVLPLTHPQQVRLVWIATESTQKLASQKRQFYHDTIKKTYQSYLGPILSCQQIGSYPLQNIYCKNPIKKGAILIGNAAHTLYPLTAQGFNLTLTETVSLAQHIQLQLNNNNPIGSLESLQDYINHQKKHYTKISRITTSIQHVFGIKAPLIGHLRSSGLLSLQLLRPLKKQLGIEMIGLNNLES